MRHISGMVSDKSAVSLSRSSATAQPPRLWLMQCPFQPFPWLANAPMPLLRQVPDGGHDDALMPRSPLDDSLAALHEIATSPSTYAPAAAAAEARRRARTSLGGAELVPNMGRQSSLASPSALLHGMDSTIQPVRKMLGLCCLSLTHPLRASCKTCHLQF